MEKHLHIITHEVPYPSGYGGVMDLYHKIRALAALGVKIHLHCFVSGKFDTGDLPDHCVSIDTYERRAFPLLLHLHLPYIVSTRISKRLTDRLRQDDHPILAEGVHCSHILSLKTFAKRKTFLRLHNVEWKYYAALGRIEKKLPRKIYFFLESLRLRHYEKKLARCRTAFCVSRKDLDTYRDIPGASKMFFLPVFHGYDCHYPGEKGGFCLYHGNLSINENEKAVRWLLKHVFSRLSIPFVVAGRRPSQELCNLINEFPNGSILADPTDEALETLCRQAQVHVLPSFNDTGVKLKLIHALASGRHCLANRAAAEGSGLESLCHFAEDAGSFKAKVLELFDMPYAADEFRKRQDAFHGLYSNRRNAEMLIEWLY